MSLLAALTVKVSAILLLTLAGVLWLRARSAAARHWVLSVGVVSACVAPGLHILPVPPVAPVGPLAWSAGPVFEAFPLRPYLPFTTPADAGEIAPPGASGPTGSRAGRTGAVAATVAHGDVVGRWAVTIWLGGVAAGAGMLLVGLARLRWLRRSARRVTDGPWHRLCADLARTCGLRRGVDLLFGSHPGLVATWGWRRPAILLPAAASDWPRERMRVVLLHELAHVRRGDWVLQMAAEALRCVWWFNPLAWLVRTRLRRESEQAADDVVLAQGVPAVACATQLVELVREARKHRRTWLPAPAMARPSHLERRLSTMLSSHTNRRPMTRFGRFWSLGLLVLASIVVASLHVAAQSSRIAGSVVDQAGEVVQTPVLTLTNRATAARLSVTGDDAGRFEFTELEPGVYSLFATKPGFERLFRRFSLEGGVQIDEELVLRLGSVEETITVTDTTELPTPVTISPATRARYLEHRNQGGSGIRQPPPRAGPSRRPSSSRIWLPSTRRPCGAAGSRARSSWTR